MADNGEATELDVKAGPVSFRGKSKYMAELISAASLTLLLLGGYAFYQHEMSTAAAFRDLTATNKEVVGEMRMQTCLMSLSEADRKAEYAAPYGFCKRMAR